MLKGTFKTTKKNYLQYSTTLANTKMTREVREKITQEITCMLFHHKRKVQTI